MDGTRSKRGKSSKAPSRGGNQRVTRSAKKSKKVSTKTQSAQRTPLDNGKIRMVNGSMEYHSKNGWIPAVYHDEIRAQLVAQGPQGTYNVPRKQGRGAGDVTSFHPAYGTYGPDRGNRHPILFRYLQNGYPVPSYTPETWMHRGRIVLDPDNDPVVRWDEIPLVLSSEYEGYEMEVVRRLNTRISFRDFRARMPRSIFKGGEWKNGWSSSALSMRNSRFRLGAVCLAWAAREGSETIKAYLDELLPPHCHAANSTEGFRDLTDYEITQAGAYNKGKYLNRAGANALDETTRQQRNEAEQERSMKLFAEHTAIIGKAPLPAVKYVAPQTRGQKRKLGETSLESKDEEENTRPTKRPANRAKIVGAAPPPANPNPSPEFSFDNIDPALLGIGKSGDFDALFGDSKPALLGLPEGVRGPDPADGPNDDWEVPQYPIPNDDWGVQQYPIPNYDWGVPQHPIPNETFGVEEFGVGQDFGSGPFDPEGNDEQAEDWLRHEEQPASEANSEQAEDWSRHEEQPSPEGNNEQAEDWSRHEEQPAPELLPHEFTNDQWQAYHNKRSHDLNNNQRQVFAIRPSHDSNNDQWQPIANRRSHDLNNNRQQTFNKLFPTGEKPDLRFAAPQSIHDKISIQYALFCTREDCRARLGTKTMGVRTSTEKCYASQWLEIQRRFAELWPLRGQGEAPVLVQLEAWFDHFDNWKE